MGLLITKDLNYKLHYSEVKEDVLRSPHDTNTSYSEDKHILRALFSPKSNNI